MMMFKAKTAACSQAKLVANKIKKKNKCESVSRLLASALGDSASTPFSMFVHVES